MVVVKAEHVPTHQMEENELPLSVLGPPPPPGGVDLAWPPIECVQTADYLLRHQISALRKG